jgi:hypothetical protein
MHEEYFAQVDTPGKRSPVGVLMVKILAKNPGINFERARTEANGLLAKAAGRRVYRIPPVYRVEEQAERKAKMLAAFKRSKTRQIAA